jgi:tRNA1Val (adenine37-N6)-methyltransferase
MSQISGDESLDAILGGTIRLLQPRRGYRFSIEPVLLGRFVRARPRDAVLDLGAGCGVLGIVVAAMNRPREVVAVEIQPQLVELIARNAALNEIANLRAIVADLRARRIAGLRPASFDLVVANPPFHALSTGRESPDRGRRIARGGTGGSLADFVAAARRYARNGARVAFVLGAARSAELISLMRSHRLEPKRIRFIHPRASLPAAAVMIEARADGGVEAAIEPPLFLHSRTGRYTDETRALLEGR